MRHALFALFCLTAPALADTIDLVLPIDCTLGETCHIQQFVDHDPGPGARDFRCGSLSYDDHRGTDFALPTLREMERGVAVLAAAAGTVRAVRDDMVDALQLGEGAPDVSGRECGNGVAITHADGYETQYCHMRQGSIRVVPGQQVAAGTPLGLVGLSGQTQFPHVHLTLRRDGAVVDPFAPDGAATCDGAEGPTLWAEPLAAPAGGIIGAGWEVVVPTFDAVKAGLPPRERLAGDAPALVVWVHLFGGRAGDRVEVVILGPDGSEVHRHGEALERTQAALFRATGRRTPPGGWPPGRYAAEVRLIRDGALLDGESLTLEVE